MGDHARLHALWPSVIGLRGISDGHAPIKGQACWNEYLHVIDEKLNAEVDLLPAALASVLLDKH